MFIDFSSATWILLRKWAEAELQRARERNDARALDPIATAALRGEIATLKKFLDLPNEVARGQVADPDE